MVSLVLKSLGKQSVTRLGCSCDSGIEVYQDEVFPNVKVYTQPALVNQLPKHLLKTLMEVAYLLVFLIFSFKYGRSQQILIEKSRF